MKLFRFFLGTILFFALYTAVAQMQIPNVKADFIQIDPYGNIYAVKESQLSKFSLQGKLLFTFADLKLGAISSIDLFNPMKIMLFYQDAGMIIFLNEQLALINKPLSLFDAGYFNISLASYSTDNKIHIYDNITKHVIVLDFYLRELSNTPLNFYASSPTKIAALEAKISAQSNETQQLPLSNEIQTLTYRNSRIVLLQDGTIWIYQ